MSAGELPDFPVFKPDCPIPDDYTRPRHFRRPNGAVIARMIRRILDLILRTVQTDGYQRTAPPTGHRVVVAQALVGRLAEGESLGAAYWTVHEAIRRGLLVADQRFEVLDVQTRNDLENHRWHREIGEPYPLVQEYDAERPAADPRRGGLPALDGVVGPDRRRFESFIVRSTDRLNCLGPDKPLDPECRRFRWRNRVYSFTPNQAVVVKKLWDARRKVPPCVHLSELLRR